MASQAGLSWFMTYHSSWISYVSIEMNLKPELNKGKRKESERKANRISYALSHRSGTERVYKDLYRLEKRKLFFEQLGTLQSIIAYRTDIPSFDAELPSPISGSVSSRGLTRVINNKLSLLTLIIRS
ncbi:hypothetical protein L873DRAFT_1818917 [Choiromyces venosus 120613-1]|uniref:Uncharacterized protein n=1 Tax=Choiromyces venosus 120613-1 TaxID=1336337 RepID=A0A3N4JD52_9PEZI|nr:hypothetical protein L873DRAFT_1818917 [Choiromyces venosus 120613-1]